MNRITAALLAAFDACITALVGIGVALVPLTILWAVQYNTSIDWIIFWRAAADVWQLGNGANLTATIDATLASTLGVAGADQSFVVSIAPLGFALVAVLLGARLGRRAAQTPHRLVAIVTAVVVYAAIAALVTLGSSVEQASIHPAQGIIWPTLVFAIGVGIGSGIASARSVEQGEIDERDVLARGIESAIDRVPAHVRAVVGASFTGGATAAAALVGLAAVIVAVLLVGSYTTAVSMYEALQGGVFGGVALTVAQLAFIPNLVIWAASWLVGPGFAIGTGSSVTPVGTALGPIPSLPVLSALPQGELAFGFVGVLVPLVGGFVAAWVVRRRLVERLGGASVLVWASAAAVGIGVVGGVIVGLLAWFSGGAAGPGRLADVGPQPLVVGGVAALEFAIAALLGMASGGRRERHEP